MANLSADFIRKTQGWVDTWKKVDFGKSPNVKLNGRKVTLNKAELKRIYKSFLQKEIENWRKKEQQKNDSSGNGLTIAKMRIQCKWEDASNSKLSKFKVALWRKKQVNGSPTDPKTPPPPGQNPPPQ